MIEQLPRVVVVGAVIRYLGREWTVDRITWGGPKWGDFYALTALDNGDYELISARGADGQYEVLPAA